jgi:DNA polymerase-1
MAHLSKDPSLIEAFNSGADIHSITASKVFHVEPEEVTPTMRRNAKAVNFGIIYGISAFGLSEDLNISRNEAKEFIDEYFETFPGVKKYLDEGVAEAKKKKYVVTEFGRRRPMPELASSNFMQRSFGERVAMNAPIQGTAADIMKLAMLSVKKRLEKEGLRARVILQVHDELLIEAPEEEKETVAKLLKEEMESVVTLSVPMIVETSTGSDWYEAK